MPPRRVHFLRWLALACAAFSLLTASPSSARKRQRRAVATFPTDWASAPSARYAALSAAQCKAQLGARKITFTPVREARGVLAPVRIIDGVGGVVYRTLLGREKRRDNAHDIFDCRLVLALDDLSAILQAHDIDVALIYSSWRPPSKRWPKARIGRRHPGALAVDIFRFGKRLEEGENERRWLDVVKDFGGQIGALSCGPKAGAPRPSTPRSREMRAIYCKAAEARIFSSMLSPNYDRAHHNHLHLEIAAKAKWRIVR